MPMHLLQCICLDQSVSATAKAPHAQKRKAGDAEANGVGQADPTEQQGRQKQVGLLPVPPSRLCFDWHCCSASNTECSESPTLRL